MIKYFCDHCGKEIRKLDNVREVFYGWARMGCVTEKSVSTVHAECLVKINKAVSGVLPKLRIPVDK